MLPTKSEVGKLVLIQKEEDEEAYSADTKSTKARPPARAILDLRDLLTDSGILRRRIFPQSWACPAPSLPLRPPQHPGLLHPIRTLLHHNPSESCIPSCRLRTRLPAIRDTSPSVVRLAAGIRRNSLPCVHSTLRCYSRQDPNTAGQAVSTHTLCCVRRITRLRRRTWPRRRLARCSSPRVGPPCAGHTAPLPCILANRTARAGLARGAPAFG